MSPIWLAIIFGVIVVPMISAFNKDLEEKIEESEKSKTKLSLLYGKIDSKEKAQKLIKLLTMSIILIFIGTAIILLIFAQPSLES